MDDRKFLFRIGRHRTAIGRLEDRAGGGGAFLDPIHVEICTLIPFTCNPQLGLRMGGASVHIYGV
jgi:hypothetical protein